MTIKEDAGGPVRAAPGAAPSLLRLLAWINVVLHGAGLVLAVVGMRPGTALVELPQRLAYLADNPPGWWLGWSTWMLCTLALIAFLAALVPYVPEHAEAARLGVILAAAGGAVDLFCDVLWTTVVPPLAAMGPAALELFLTVERIASAGGLIVANGLYSVAILLLTYCLRGRPGLSRLAYPVGWGVFLSGMLLVGAGFTGVARHAEWATGPTIGLFCLWTILVAYSLNPGGSKS